MPGICINDDATSSGPRIDVDAIIQQSSFNKLNKRAKMALIRSPEFKVVIVCIVCVVEIQLSLHGL